MDETPSQPQLPAPLLESRFSDVRSLYTHAMLMNSLSTTSYQLRTGTADDDPVVAQLAARYRVLRENFIELVLEEGRSEAARLLPEIPEGDAVTIGQVAYAADQASTWVNAATNVDDFVVRQRVAAYQVGVVETRGAEMAAAQAVGFNVSQNGAKPDGGAPGQYL